MPSRKAKTIVFLCLALGLTTFAVYGDPVQQTSNDFTGIPATNASDFPVIPADPGLQGMGAAPVVPYIVDPSRITAVYQRLVGRWAAGAEIWINGLFGVLALVDLTIFVGFLKANGHTLDTALLSLMKKFMAVGFCLFLFVNGTTYLPMIINFFVQIGRSGSGLPSIGPSMILQTGVNISSSIIGGSSYSVLHLDFGPAAAAVVASAFVMLAFTIMTIQFVVAQIDIYIAIGAVGRVALALGGSKWTVPYVERMFAFCVASGIKMMATYLLLGGAADVTADWQKEAVDMAGSAGSTISGYIIAAGGVILAFVVYHCSKLVSSALGGSPSMTGSDAVAFLMPAATAATGVAGMALGALGPMGGMAGAAAGAASTVGSMAVQTGSGIAANMQGSTNGASASAPPLAASADSTGQAPHHAPPSGGVGRSGGGGIGGTARTLGNLGLQVAKSIPPTPPPASGPSLHNVGH